MTRIPYCLIKPDVAYALRALVHTLNLKIPEGDLGFLCPACKKPVKSFKDHFEHLPPANPQCPLVLRWVQTWQPPAAKTRRAVTT
jgi:hypothetical protein